MGGGGNQNIITSSNDLDENGTYENGSQGILGNGGGTYKRVLVWSSTTATTVELVYVHSTGGTVDTGVISNSIESRNKDYDCYCGNTTGNFRNITCTNCSFKYNTDE